MSSNIRLSALFSALLIGSSASGEMLSLSRAYSLSLENEPKLKSSRYQTEAAQELVNQSRARFLPQLQGSVAWGYYDYNAEYLASSVRETYSNYSISASQALFRPELLRAIDEDQARAKQTEYKYKQEAQQLGFDVAKAYFYYMHEVHSLDLSRSQKEYYEMKYNQLQELLKVGLTTKIDMLEAKVHRDQAISEWMTEQKRLEVAKLKLEYYIGEKVDTVAALDFESIDLELFKAERSSYEDKLENNPALNASKSAGDIARHQLAAREYDHYPKIDLNINRKETYSKDRLSHQYDNQAIVQMSIPIYQGGYAQSRVRQAMKNLDASAQSIDYLRKDTRLRFETYWADHALMIEKIDFLRQSITSAELYVTAMEQGHTAGIKSIVDVLDAKAKLYEVKRDLIDAGYDLVNSQISLLDLTGELNAESIGAFERQIVR